MSTDNRDTSVPTLEITTSTMVESVDLPTVYVKARKALARCSRIDEVKSWADEAAALASYAKQANDETLHRYADRIKARAIRRMGKLLEQVEPAKGGDRRSKGGHPSVDSRKAAAAAAGLSEHQTKQALRMATVRMRSSPTCQHGSGEISGDTLA